MNVHTIRKRKIDLEDGRVNLRGDEKFPVAIAEKPAKLSAYDFAATTSSEYQFGMDRERAAALLRKLADKIESGEAILQSGRVVTTCSREDYPMTFLRLTFYEGPKKKGKEVTA